MPTVTYLTGFEHGLHSISGGGLFSTLTGTAPTIDTAVVKDGVYSLKVPVPASAFECDNGLYTPSGTGFVMRFHFRFTGNPSSSILISESTVSAGISFTVRLEADGTIAIRCFGGTSPVDSAKSAVLAVDTWHLIEIVYDVSTTAYKARHRTNGVEASTDATQTGPAAGALTTVKMGCTNLLTLSTARDLWFDNVICGTTATTLTASVAFTDYWGDGKVIKILPASDGTHSFTDNDFSTGDAGTQRAVGYTDFWQMVDDAVPWTVTRDVNDNIAQRVVRSTAYVEINPADTPEFGTANAVRALLEYSADATGADTAGCIIRNSTPTAVVIWGDLPTAQGGNNGALADYSEITNFFKGVIATKPAAGWTPAEINALHWRFGGAGDVIGIPTVQALMLEVDYPPGGAPPPLIASDDSPIGLIGRGAG
jgi:hypothetical protein